ncbi:MAG: 30S ribosomal protein S1 [Anaerolineae bacterium]
MDEQDKRALPTTDEEAQGHESNPMHQYLEQEFGQVVPRRNEIMEGIILDVTPNEVVVDIGCKAEGIVSARDLERVPPEVKAKLRPGAKVHVFVLRPEDANGHSVLSLSRALSESDWKLAEDLLASGEVYEGTVADANRGGLIVNVGRVRGFVPASQVASLRLPRGMSDDEREQALKELTGNPIAVKVMELDRRRNRLILSERAAAREWRLEQKERLLDELKEGDVRKGVVSSLCDFGAFVDLGGADGLIHLSELSYSRVGHPKQVLQVGQQVEVYVLGVDHERRRIALSLKRLKAEPWTMVEQNYSIGQRVTGTITNVTDFGAFARLDEDIEGLIHISELSDQRITHPSEVVKVGDQVELRVIRIDSARQRLGLSLRRVNDDTYFEDYDWEDASQLSSIGNDDED